jgi:uncharacterized protein (DUF1810 family)
MAPEIFQHTRALELLRAGSGNADAQFRQGQLEAIGSVFELGSWVLPDDGSGPAHLISPLLGWMGNQTAPVGDELFRRASPGARRVSTPADDLQRFHTAQGHGSSGTYAHALRELQAGRKQSHWIWFVLPQLAALGRSAMALRYGIADLEEARAYLADPLLRRRLEEVIAVIAVQLQQPGMSLTALMGGELDAAKTISSLTLFEAAGLASATPVLNQLGRRCPRTLAALGG